MLDQFTRELITHRMNGLRNYRSLIAIGVVAYAAGMATALGLGLLRPGIADDHLAKLAALASRSTGQPATVIWMEAQANQSWPRRPEEIAKRLLVDIDVGQCGIRQASNGDRYDGKPLALYPGHRNN